jgi:hypothetical protein
MYDFDIELAIVHVGWDEEGAPAIDEIVTLISGPFEALRE